MGCQFPSVAELTQGGSLIGEGVLGGDCTLFLWWCWEPDGNLMHEHRGLGAGLGHCGPAAPPTLCPLGLGTRRVQEAAHQVGQSRGRPALGLPAQGDTEQPPTLPTTLLACYWHEKEVLPGWQTRALWGQGVQETCSGVYQHLQTPNRKQLQPVIAAGSSVLGGLAGVCCGYPATWQSPVGHSQGHPQGAGQSQRHPNPTPGPTDAPGVRQQPSPLMGAVAMPGWDPPA